MNFDLTEDQTLLKASIERFLEDHYDLEKRRRYLAEPGGFSAGNWRLLAELGILALPFPADDGGLDGSFTDLMVVMEAMGRGLLVEPFITTVVFAGGLLRRLAADPRRVDLAGRIIGGDLRLAVAHAERTGRFNLAHVATTARRTSDGWTLDGQKTLVLHAETADALLVLARTSGATDATDGLSLFLVPADTPGLGWRHYRTADGQSASEVDFHGTALPSTALLGPEGDAWVAFEDSVTETSLALCGEAIGLMSALFDATLDYVKTRNQFGQAIGAFQAVQHRMADGYVGLEQSRGLLYKAVMTDSAEVGRAAWMRTVAGTKAFISEAGLKLGHEAIQLHGGMGTTDELVVSHLHKRMVMIATLFGDAACQIERYNALATA
ncbi:acyl-CoA dehydrogenase family protein [Parapedomonas caeni]